MSAYAPLLASAMIGTEKHPVVAPAIEGDVGALLAAVTATETDDTEKMLACLAALSACVQAGRQGAHATGGAPAAAPPDTLPRIENPEQVALLQWTFAEGSTRLQQQVCLALARRGMRLADVVLPAALDAGARSRALRAALLPALGVRGRWLATQHDAWAYASLRAQDDDIDQRWNEGSLDERVRVLREERATAPANARERLAASFDELPARDRGELLPILAIGLSADDETFLAAQLKDRSRDVRQGAASLLAALPSSALAARAATRLDALLKQERRLLVKTWVIEAPEAAGADWKADGIDAARPNGESLGERAWWLYLLARQVPLAWWTARLSMTPADLLKWAKAGAWTEALVRAWLDALLIERDVAWCEALLDDWPAKLLSDPATIAMLLPPALREKHWERQLGGKWLGARVPVTDVVGGILTACVAGETVSTSLSDRLADAFAADVQSATVGDWRLNGLLPELCCVLDRTAAARLANLPLTADATPAMLEMRLSLNKTIAVRTAFDF